MVCSNCQAETSGRFCSECGESLVAERCSACDAELPAKARYCTRCGEPATGAAPGVTVTWWITAVLLGLVLAVFVLPGLRPTVSASSVDAAGTGLPPVAQPASGAGAMSPPPLTGTPREQADRLFNRVMEAFAAGDSSGGRFFLPMAIDAYEIAAPLNADGLFHLSLLRIAAGEAAAGLVAAEQILAEQPNHLLGLAAAAQAAAVMGDGEAAREYFRQFLGAYDAESARDVQEYVEHAPMLPLYREEAERYLR